MFPPQRTPSLTCPRPLHNYVAEVSCVGLACGLRPCALHSQPHPSRSRSRPCGSGPITFTVRSRKRGCLRSPRPAGTAVPSHRSSWGRTCRREADYSPVDRSARCPRRGRGRAAYRGTPSKARVWPTWPTLRRPGAVVHTARDRCRSGRIVCGGRAPVKVAQGGIGAPLQGGQARSRPSGSSATPPGCHNAASGRGRTRS
jgi:hypothetical protein